MTNIKVLRKPKAFNSAGLSARKQAIRDLSDHLAPGRKRWRDRNRYFHQDDLNYMRFLIPEGARVLDLGCGTGDLLAALKPAYGIGVDISEKMIGHASETFPELDFRVGDIEDAAFLDTITGKFDYIVISDTVGSLEDCQASFESLHRFCERHTRLVVVYYSHFWEPVLRLAESLHLKMPQMPQNFLPSNDLAHLLELSDFDVVKRDWRQLIPRSLFGIGRLINRFVGTIPGIRRLCLRNYVIARSLRRFDDGLRSCSIVIPCRNEKGNVESAVKRMPAFSEDQEIIFVEGHSSDGTFEEAKRMIEAYPDRDIKVFRQDGKGKGDAVLQAFDSARGDVLMILDADLTMPPEQLSKYWRAITEGKGEFINGSRLVYPMEREAMRLLNLIANHLFSQIFSWLLNQRITDTLCGTKVIRRSDYETLKRNRAYFGDFDPFGDFDLIFGASKMNLKIVDIPIRYASRTYGETQISRFRHGLLLLRMVMFAYRKLKAI